MEDRFIRRARLGPRLAWPVLAPLLTSLVALAGDMPWGHVAAAIMPPLAVFTIACESSWFLVKAMPLRTSALMRVVLSHVISAAVLSAAWIAGIGWWSPLASRIVGTPGLSARLREQMPLLFGLGIFYYLLVAAYYHLAEALAASREASEREAAARLLARESELKALRAQINPHFLFNSLHSISALTSIDPQAARGMCILLGDYLRNTLGSSEKPRLSLSDEIKLAKQYLAVEQVRFGSRMIVQESLEPASLDCLLPPLLLQPLVENAIKHGVATMAETTRVHLESAVQDGWLLITVSNQYDSESRAKPGAGVGLNNVRERLSVSYGEAARLNSKVRKERGKSNCAFLQSEAIAHDTTCQGCDCGR